MPVKVTDEKVILTLGQSKAVVYILGATLTSWICNGLERLFVSKKAIYSGPKAIRGGIPLVFPQFGPIGKLPQHGFARVSNWKWMGITKETDSLLTVSFSLDPDSIPKAQKELWNYKFYLIYNVTLENNKLITELVIKNTCIESFEFTTLLHTYFRVKDSSKISVTGLKGFELKDSLNSHRSTEEREQVTINSEVDRVYENVSTDLMVQNTQIGNGISIKKENFKDVVVWNPWIENAKKMVDFDDNEYLEMVCVEVGTVATFVKLNPNEEWRGKQTLECL